MPHLISRLLVSMAKCHSNAKISSDVMNGNWQENQTHVKKTPQKLRSKGWDKIQTGKLVFIPEACEGSFGRMVRLHLGYSRCVSFLSAYLCGSHTGQEGAVLNEAVG